MRRPPPAFRHLCREASRAIHDYRMIVDGDRIAVGLSGGKDSMLLMHILDYLKKRAPVRFEITAVIVDGGFEVFRSDLLAQYCKQAGWEYRIVRVDLKNLILERGLDGEPCAFCSRLKRGKIYGAAHDLGCNKLALGQHLDDICSSFLLGLFRGKGLATMGAHVDADSGRLRLVRPLVYLPESAMVQAAGDFSFPDCGKCDFLEQVDREGDRAWLEDEVTRLDGRFPQYQAGHACQPQKSSAGISSG